MPNWCRCRLKITGKPGDRKAFVDACYMERPAPITEDDCESTGKVLGIQESLLPMPADLEDTRSPTPLYYDAVYAPPERIDEILRYPWVQEAGVQTQQELIELLAAKNPEDVLSAAKNRECFEKYGVSDWYEWMITNWGSQWADCNTVAKDHEDVLVLWFDTAWSPPIEGIVTISEQFPDLTFELEYQERGVMLDGGCVIKNGAVRKHWENEYAEGEDESNGF